MPYYNYQLVLLASERKPLSPAGPAAQKLTKAGRGHTADTATEVPECLPAAVPAAGYNLDTSLHTCPVLTACTYQVRFLTCSVPVSTTTVVVLTGTAPGLQPHTLLNHRQYTQFTCQTATLRLPNLKHRNQHLH